jgi:hypothetical protein
MFPQFEKTVRVVGECGNPMSERRCMNPIRKIINNNNLKSKPDVSKVKS